MQEITGNKLLDEAIWQNKKWIITKCKFTERNKESAEDLYQNVMLNLYRSGKKFMEGEEIIKPDHWVKKVTSNITANYIREKVKQRKIQESVDLLERKKIESNQESLTLLNTMLEYINSNFEDRDREIMMLYMMKESHGDIAEIVGMTQGSVTNRILVLKEKLNDFLNEGN
ncbi:MAG: hypothetical protein A2381_19005 [Bdellovibrionales bacterium RIFOXYB1_FULL_37_110]|nr:MAG: hypothetical protein A2417_13095 [Bdellovibrionales bacterium RIFOXYC1_FULL_37_79]OFZ59882.1 MAG: hypothetical protein A2381_19005 [Bdellovibrionales bacterium RIFOXYB1_FULL_37_110]OFZ63503.1 MAG: hypothetical protein A2577_06455 [Bdellovibrionales bacterium RIFOXYD1_FULL_36_51]